MKTSLEKLVASKIPVLWGRAAKTNLMVLELLAFEGSQTTYNINKLLGRSREQYPTIFRTVTRLKEGGYIAETGTVRAAKKIDWITTYGLTWRGFITSLISDRVCSDVFNVFEKNPQLRFPLPREIVLLIGEEWLGDEQTEKLVRSLFEGFIRAIPDDIESIEEETYPAYLLPTFMRAQPTLAKIKPKDPSRLPFILKEIEQKSPQAINWLEEEVENHIKNLEETLERAKETRKIFPMIREMRTW